MRSHLRTPLIVDVDKTPEEYIKGLNKPARKNYAAAMKLPYWFAVLDYDKALVREFMGMWSKQIGGGWTFGPEYFDALNENGCLVVFAAGMEDCIAVLPMECFGDFMYAQPVLYRKDKHPKVAKFVWFKMLEWACGIQNIKVIDLGGGFNGSWDQFIQTRGGPSFKYKWRFVAQAVKENPDSQRPLFVQRCQCGWKFLTLGPQACPNCGDVPCQMYG